MPDNMSYHKILNQEHWNVNMSMSFWNSVIPAKLYNDWKIPNLNLTLKVLKVLMKLEQLERLRSENTHRRPMITHTMDSYQIPCHNKTKSNVTNSKNLPMIKNLECYNNRYTRHTFWSCLIRCANMKWIRLVLWKKQSGHHFVQMDGQMDRRMDDGRPIYPVSTSLKWGI